MKDGLKTGMGVKMKNKKIAALAVAGAAVVLIVCGTFAAKTVRAAEESVTISSEVADTALQARADVEVMQVYKNTFYGDTGCTMVLPAGYVASDSIKGMYVAERHPMDSSNVYYTVAENADAEALSEAIKTEQYKDQIEARFKASYGEDAQLDSYQVEETKISGCPAYKIRLSCSAGDMQMDQLIYIIMADQVYTITYSQSADDERMEDFEKSAETIQVFFENQMA